MDKDVFNRWCRGEYKARESFREWLWITFYRRTIGNLVNRHYDPEGASMEVLDKVGRELTERAKAAGRYLDVEKSFSAWFEIDNKTVESLKDRISDNKVKSIISLINKTFSSRELNDVLIKANFSVEEIQIVTENSNYFEFYFQDEVRFKSLIWNHHIVYRCLDEIKEHDHSWFEIEGDSFKELKETLARPDILEELGYKFNRNKLYRLTSKFKITKKIIDSLEDKIDISPLKEFLDKEYTKEELNKYLEKIYPHKQDVVYIINHIKNIHDIDRKTILDFSRKIYFLNSFDLFEERIVSIKACPVTSPDYLLKLREAITVYFSIVSEFYEDSTGLHMFNYFVQKLEDALEEDNKTYRDYKELLRKFDPFRFELVEEELKEYLKDKLNTSDDNINTRLCRIRKKLREKLLHIRKENNEI